MHSEPPGPASSALHRQRLRVLLRGAVQGVGFRPFVYRVASELDLAGWVNNSVKGVAVEVEGTRSALDIFLSRLQTERPSQSVLQEVECEWLQPVGYTGFEIRESEPSGIKTALVLPDIATCSGCVRDVFEPGNRRFGYPFTNCTHCGPRFTIIESLPYDRANTSMKAFVMCPACQREYDDPRDRRFHAQPNACPACGPRLELWDATGRGLDSENDALERAAAALRDGAIVAVKGLGGFHLIVSASSDAGVRRLRQLKHREEKPFALMFRSLDQVRGECDLSVLEQQLLESAAAPIVLLRRIAQTLTPNCECPIQNSRVSSLVAPGNPHLGVMLPSTPLHHLLMRRFDFPVVATSGNLSEEPICTDELEAVRRLGGMVDLFLVHNRPIVRHVDDSIVRVIAGRELVLRRARGYAPLPITLNTECGDAKVGQASWPSSAQVPARLETTSKSAQQHAPDPASPPVLAVGGHLKNTIALSVGNNVFISQHIGDLETLQARAAFERVIADFEQFYETKPTLIVADAHPDYLSTQYAARTGLPVVHVQHHFAHVLSCMAENGLADDVLGVSWDGTGWGSDSTIWGGEFLVITETSFQRFGHMRTFRLPGGDQAIKEPRRSALGLLFELFGDTAFDMHDLAPVRAFTRPELQALRHMLRRKLNSPVTSSAGRLFDAVASLLGLRQRVAFEGQAAMELEWALANATTWPESFDSPASATDHGPRNSDHTPIILDWAPLIHTALASLRNGLPIAQISMRFHDGLVESLVRLARLTQRRNVVLSGGCFQNKYLTERAIVRLREVGVCPFWHRSVPPNDGGIALGQILAARRLNRRK